ncbi:MAG: TolC family protein [Deltaproteobacteria bacterium]|nr:TolC family protein [Deltaproteobacteria bacterium]
MLREGGQVACHDVMTIDFSLIGMAIQRRVRGGMKILCLSLMLVMAFLGCNKAMPELGPDKFTSTAPGKAYVVPKEKKQEALPAKKLPGLSDERQPSGHDFTLAQLVDVALRINPSTKVAWERARSAAAQWGVARGDYYPTISGDVSGAAAGGSARGVLGQVGVSLNYLLLDFGGREASVESARQALAAANWNHNQVIQDVLRNVPQAYYEYIGYKAQVRASEASLKEALTSLDSTEQRRSSFWWPTGEV